MKQVFLVALDGSAIRTGHQILGFLSSNDREVIANYIKNIYNLTLQDLLPNRFVIQNGCHWEYLTNKSGINIHVDICYNLE